MAVELKVPEVGESITEVQIGEWLKSEGESIRRDEVIVMIETDKVTVELPAPVDGVLSSIKVASGESANVGDIVGYMEEGAVAASTPETAGGEAPAQTSHGGQDADESSPEDNGQTRAGPAARRALAEAGVAATDVKGTGPGGRILKEDVARYVKEHEPKSAPAARSPGLPPPAMRSDAETPARHEEVVAMTPMRQRIAERLVSAQQTAALLTTFNEIDMSQVMKLRKDYQPLFTEKYGIKLGFMSFFVKATVDALKLFPAVNAEVRDTSIVYRNYFDVGVAVGGGKGLVVPVIRNAERLSFAEIEKTIADFGARAKKNALKLDELQGGTFTISNGGVYGSLLSTPIINPPQSGILGLHGIVERPIALDGQVVIRPMMYVALTYDHRVVDGREAVTFLKRIKEGIEQPARMLLEI